MKNNNYLTILSLVIIFSSLIQSGYVIIKVHNTIHIPISTKAISQNSARITLCINRAPENLTMNCVNRTREGVLLYCEMNASDPDGGNMTFSASGAPGFLSMTTDGYITIRTYRGVLEYPPMWENYYDYIGNHSINLDVYEDSICGGAVSTLNYQIEVYDYNDKPFLSQQLTDKVIPLNQQVALFSLNSHFKDPERKTLTFTHNAVSGMVITVLNSGDVLALSTTCDSQALTFTATDHGGLTAVSNTITVSVDCGTAEEGSGDTSSSESGGSGGGTYTPICVSNWECDPWTKCTLNGTRTRTCIDLNACNPNYFIHEVIEQCEYVPPPECEEFWECTDWSACTPANIQTRECTELNGCGTQDNKPITAIDCVYEPTCNDGIQNQEETGVDCGGPCLPCKNLEIPGSIKEQKTIISSLLLILVLIILSLLLVYKYFHKQINSAVIKMLLSFTHKTSKRILLSEEDKKQILESLIELEKDAKNNLKKKLIDSSMIGREYLSKIFKTPISISEDLLKQYINELKIKEPLNNVLISFHKKIVLVETERIKPSKIELLLMIEEIRELIHLTSRFNREDIKKEEKEIAINKRDQGIFNIKKQMYNLFIAMHFDQIEVCKQKYSEIINIYENLSEKEK
ncbi:MAG: hypothetical protein KKF89_03845, partial [Nanoarchaeota archaeon]|nr:hypothetical protein [Nanoarchaeota archaeon]